MSQSRTNDANPLWHVVPVLNGWRAWSASGEPGMPASHDRQAVEAEVVRRNALPGKAVTHD